MRLASIVRAPRNSARSADPRGPDFSGWNCTPKTLSGFEHRGVGHACKCRWPRSPSITGHVVAVREVDVGLARRVRAAAATALRGSSSFQPMCGTRASPGNGAPRRRRCPRPRTSGASSLDVEQRLQAEADAEERHAGADALDAALRARCSASSARIIWPKWPTPGRMIFVGRAQSGGIAHQRVVARRSRPACSAPSADCRRRNRRWRS